MIFLHKKIFITLIIGIFFCSITCYADDITESTTIDKNLIDESIETVSTLNSSPIINSKAAIIFDRNSKEILYGKNENIKKPMASTTKIMTALVVIENSDLDTVIQISEKAARTGGSRLNLKTGDKISIRDLLYGLMLKSGNDCAVALAETIGGSIEEFANLMNKKSNELNLYNTHFVFPHGLDAEEHYTTAFELAVLTDYALKNDTFSKIVGTKTINISINGQNRTIMNTNELLGNLSGVYGVKTGFTNGAGRCLVTSTKRDNMDIICIVLGADTKKDRTKDSVKLIEYTFKNYQTITLNNKIIEYFNNWVNNINSNNINIKKGVGNHLNLKLDMIDENISYSIIKNTENEIFLNITTNSDFCAPIHTNSQIGKLQVIYKDKIIKEIDILNINLIPKKNINNYLFEFIKNYYTYFEKVTI